jgi:hypothetical protein
VASGSIPGSEICIGAVEWADSGWSLELSALTLGDGEGRLGALGNKPAFKLGDSGEQVAEANIRAAVDERQEELGVAGEAVELGDGQRCAAAPPIVKGRCRDERGGPL